MPRAIVAIVAFAVCGCAAAPPPASRAVPGAVASLAGVDHLDERALLLLLTDRKLYEPLTVERSLDGGPDLREQLAVALGRVGDDRGTPVLEGLLQDDVVAVRRAAAFALGELGDRQARDRLLAAARDPDDEVGRLAVEALGKLDADVLAVGDALGGLPESTRWARLLPSLYRFKRTEIVPLAESGLGLEDRELHTWAAYALCREPQADGLPAVRRLLADPDPEVRAWAARAIGKIGEGADIAGLRPLLDDAAEGPVVQALRAAGALVADGRAAAPEVWREALLARFDDPRPGVRVTALEVASAWLLDPTLEAALLARAQPLAGRESEVALMALARGRDPRAPELVDRAAGSSDSSLRAVAAMAAGAAGLAAVLERLGDDATPRVRLAVLDARLAGAEASAAAREALSDTDPAVRTEALDWLTEHPEAPADAIADAMVGPAARQLVDLRLSAIRALVARAQASAAERPAIVLSLQGLASDDRYLVRRAAVDGLVALGGSPKSPGAVESDRTLQTYREIVLQTRQPRYVELTTERGAVRVRLDCPAAPLTCLNFLHLATQGFYDGLTFHRVVPDFVVQGGDPRGDGWGGPGYTIRDEINRIRYQPGVLGMALSGPDTGGSQFFFTLAREPHLDGGYTAFGEVIGGLEVLERIEQGDRIEKIEEVLPPELEPGNGTPSPPPSGA